MEDCFLTVAWALVSEACLVIEDDMEESLEEEREFANEGTWPAADSLAFVSPFRALSFATDLLAATLVICVVLLAGVAEIVAGGFMEFEVVVSSLFDRFPDSLERGKAIRLEVAARRAAVCSVRVADGFIAVLGANLLEAVDRSLFRDGSLLRCWWFPMGLDGGAPMLLSAAILFLLLTVVLFANGVVMLEPPTALKA